MTDQEHLELKGWGHQLLDTVALSHKIHRNDVYKLLAKQLRVKERDAHFSRMDVETTQRAIKILRVMSQRKFRPPQKPNPNSKKQQTKQYIKELKEANAAKPYEEIKKAIRELPKQPLLPVHERLLIRVKGLFAPKK
jgi:hypothetical protein